jgi:hypothetical protein
MLLRYKAECEAQLGTNKQHLQLQGICCLLMTGRIALIGETNFLAVLGLPATFSTLN